MKAALEQIKYIINHTELIRFLVKCEFKEKHTNMLLGYLWWILNPLLWMVVYLFLVQIVFSVREPNYSLFLLCGLLPWRAFSLSVTKCMSSVQARGSIIKQVSIPKAIFPVSVVISETLMLIPGFILILLIGQFYGIAISFNLIYLPFIILIQMGFSLCLGFVLSIVSVHIPDVKNIMVFLLRMWLYMSPVLYTADRIPEKFQAIYNLNPFVFILESYRDILFYARTPNLEMLAVFIGVVLLLLFISLLFFSSQERNIVKAF